jgi:hypothetical protein
MIRITVLTNAHGKALGFKTEGHAGFDDYGYDIVCAAVSVLELNLANSVQELTGAEFSCQVDEDKGSFSFRLRNRENEKAVLLLDSCLLGLEAVRQQYGSNFLTIREQEV